MSTFFTSVFLNGTIDLQRKGLPFEPLHDKNNKTSVRPAKTQISLGLGLYSLSFGFLKKGFLLGKLCL